MKNEMNTRITFRLCDVDRRMLAALSDEMRISESSVIRLLIAREYRQMIGGANRGTE